MTDAADIGPPQPAVTAAPSATSGRTDLLAVGAAAVTVVLWASAFVGIRAASETLEAPTIALARLLIGSAVLGAAVAVRRSRLPSRTALRPLLVCGTLWFGLYNLALNQGERLVDPGTAAMLVNVAPIVIAAVAGRVLGEGFRSRCSSAERSRSLAWASSPRPPPRPRTSPSPVSRCASWRHWRTPRAQSHRKSGCMASLRCR